MTKSSTHLDLNIPENNASESKEHCNENNNSTMNPSDSVIRNLLNYSRALSVVSLKFTGNAHTILLN